MAKFPADGSSYIEIDDLGGTPRNLAPYVDEIVLLGQKVAFLDVTGVSDTARHPTKPGFPSAGGLRRPDHHRTRRGAHRNRGPNRNCQSRPGGEQLRAAQNKRGVSLPELPGNKSREPSGEVRGPFQTRRRYFLGHLALDRQRFPNLAFPARRSEKLES